MGEERALEVGETFAEALRLHQAKQFPQAEQLYRRLLAAQPDHADARHLLGVLACQTGRLAEGVDSLRQAIALRPQVAAYHGNLGSALGLLGRLEEASASLRQVVALRPDDPAALAALADCLRRQGRVEEATPLYRRLVALSPDDAAALSNLGSALAEQNVMGEAMVCFRRALELQPHYPQAQSNLGLAYKELGQHEAAVACFRAALRLRPDYWEAYSNLLFCLNYAVALDPLAAREEAARFGALATQAAGQAFTNWHCEAAPKSLRVGFVSGDLLEHPVSYFLEGLLAPLATQGLKLHAYVTHDRQDGVTQRLRCHFASWTSLVGMSDGAAAAKIRDDGIHLLIDLAGHTGHNRLPLFAWRPAPLQVSWLGYFATTGLAEIDYLLADRHMVPAGEAEHFTEAIWNLPESHWCFTLPTEAEEVGPLPALANGFVTFGCFNNLTKVNDGVLDLWARLLQLVAGSRLFLKARQLGEATAREALLARFAARGIGPERLILEGPSSRRELLRAYHRVDLALDPFPFPGGTTSVEGLWMGVPVLTRRGHRFVSHQGESIAHNLGLSPWIAQDDGDYLVKAVQLSGDLAALSRLRGELRPRMRASCLTDAPRFAAHLAQALWEMWGRAQH